MYNDIYDKEQYAYIYATLCKWLQVKIDGGSIADGLHKLGVKTIALYGISGLGEYAYGDIRNSEIEISCFVDKRYADFPNGISGIPVYSVNDIPKVDAVLVTPVFYFCEIFNTLLKSGVEREKIISLSMLLS